MGGYLLVADGTRPETLGTALTLHDRAQEAAGEVPFFLLVNKVDLKEAADVEWGLSSEVLDDHGLSDWPVLYTSAKDGTRVEETFTGLAEAAVRGLPRQQWHRSGVLRSSAAHQFLLWIISSAHMAESSSLPHRMLAALDVVVFERVEPHRFVCRSPAPPWLETLVPTALDGDETIPLADHFLFLHSFLQRAGALWDGPPDPDAAYTAFGLSALRSASWTEHDDERNEHLLEATALLDDDRAFLLIHPASIDPAEHRAVLEEGRTEERTKQKLRDAFASYVPASLADQVTENSDALELGGEKKKLTVLFCDLRRFTTYSEHLAPQKVVTFLNRFFDRMTTAVFEHDGTVDKFIGDGMMAIFGAPLDLSDHSTRACGAALSMAEGLDTLNQDSTLDAAGPDAPISVGLGINTGEMVAGNIGSSQRFEYTVVGDAVNLAARIEPLNRILGTRILVSEMTYQDLDSNPWTFLELGSVRVKGREDPVTLYELLDPNTYPEPDVLCTRFEEALTLYHQREFAAARAAFEECRALHSEDGPASYYVGRCVACENDPHRYEPILDLRSPNK